jgi:hypothetical protein
LFSVKILSFRLDSVQFEKQKLESQQTRGMGMGPVCPDFKKSLFTLTSNLVHQQQHHNKGDLEIPLLEVIYLDKLV